MLPALKDQFLEQVNEVKLYRDLTLIAVAVKLPTGAVETIVNYHDLDEKVEYYDKNYDNAFRLKRNEEVRIVDFMVV